MNPLKLVLMGLFIFLSLLPSFARAGGSDGSGGKGVVCRALDGSIESVEVLDLWEERIIRKNPIVVSTRSIAEQVADAIETLKGVIEIAPGSFYEIRHEGSLNGKGPISDYNANYLRAYANLFLKDSKRLSRLRDVKLTLTNDSFEAAQPTGRCGIEQVVNFVDSGSAPEILVNQDLLEKMDDTNKAALYVHEAFYLFLRGFGSEGLLGAYREPNSIRIRRAVGYIFSGHKFESIDRLVGTEYISCFGGSSDRPAQSFLYFFKDDKGQARIANTVTFGRPVIGFFPQLARVFLPWDEVLKMIKGSSCSYAKRFNPITRENYDPDAQIYGNPGVGPVDFQMLSWIDVLCSQKKTVFYLYDETTVYDGERSERRRPQKLECRLEKPGAKSGSGERK